MFSVQTKFMSITHICMYNLIHIKKNYSKKKNVSKKGVIKIIFLQFTKKNKDF